MMNTTSARKALQQALGAFVMTGAVALAMPALAQQAYPSPSAAADAFVDSLARNDDTQLKTVLGAGYGRYIPPETADYQDRLNFLAAWAPRRGRQSGPAPPIPRRCRR